MRTPIVLLSATTLLLVAFAQPAASLGGEACVEAGSCSADYVAVCVAGDCEATGLCGVAVSGSGSATSDNCGVAIVGEGTASGGDAAIAGRGESTGPTGATFLAVSGHGESYGFIAVTGTLDRAEGSFIAVSGTGEAEGGFIAVGGTGAQGGEYAVSISGATTATGVAVSQCGQPASATYAISVFCEAQGTVVGAAPGGSGSCGHNPFFCVAIGRAAASCTAGWFCVAVGGQDTPGGPQCSGTYTTELLYVCAANAFVPIPLP